MHYKCAYVLLYCNKRIILALINIIFFYFIIICTNKDNKLYASMARIMQ